MAAARAYGEVESRRWLAWLARRMRHDGNTVFMIEHLQPDSLTNGRQLWAYALLSRTAGGAAVFGAIALCLAIAVAPSMLAEGESVGGLAAGVLGVGLLGLLVGGGLGIVVALALIARFERRRALGFLAGALAAILAGGSFLLLLGIAGSLPGEDGEIVAMLALILGVTVAIWAFRVRRRSIESDIHPVETLRFSWETFRARVFRWGWYLLFAPASIVINVIVAAVVSYRVQTIEQKTRPNEGIRLSIRNALMLPMLWGLIGGAVGATIGLLAGLGDGLAGAVGGAASGGVVGFAIAATPGVVAGFVWGGAAAISHFALRVVLRASGRMPLRYDRFLDHAADELRFLQRVGGGYMFIHRYLLEHFAQMEAVAVERSEAAPPLVQPARAG